MGACIQCCYLSETGTTCCTILSVLGVLYFLIMFLIFESQKNFFDISLPNPDDTKISFLIAMLVYLAFFGICAFRMFKMGNNKKKGALKLSINQVKQLGSLNQLRQQNKNFSAKQMRQD